MAFPDETLLIELLPLAKKRESWRRRQVTRAGSPSLPPPPPVMARTDLDRALLGEDLTSEVTLRNVASLSPVQLAVVASRDDLNHQVQTRACTTFLSQKAAFEAAGATQDPSQG